MTQQETNRVMAILSAAYPAFYRNQSQDDIRAARDLWQQLFADEPYAVVSAAVTALIKTRTSTYPPVPGEVSDQIYKLTHQDELSDADAWAMVKRAVCNSLYNSSDEYARLPERVQRCVGSPSQLRDWSMMPVDELDSVVASNFRRAYSARRQADREYAALPAETRALLSETAALMLKQLPE